MVENAVVARLYCTYRTHLINMSRPRRRSLTRTGLVIIAALAIFGVYVPTKLLKSLQGQYRLTSVLIAEQHINLPIIGRKRSSFVGTAAPQEMKFVICAKVRNEAPYLREWIEYHRMIGFESFLLMNDKSTDATQCILDEYAKEGIVQRIPEEINESVYGKQDISSELDTSRVKERVYDICTKYLASQGDAHRTWMMTHDTDEFVWFNKTNGIDSFSNAIQNLRQRHGSSVQSILVPRYVVGSSGREEYQPDLVIDRFNHRFNLENCPADTRGKDRLKENSPIRSSQLWPLRKPGWPSIQRRSHSNRKPQNVENLSEEYCSKENSYDGVKSISLVSSLALDCTSVDRKTDEIVPILCVKTHWHSLKPLSSNATAATHEVSAKDASKQDSRYLLEDEVGESIAIMHYITKSRHEFVDRVCESSHGNSYRCPGCTPTKYFNLTDEFASNYKDDRMAQFSVQLKPILESSTIGGSCDTRPKQRSLEYYHECFERLKGKKYYSNSY